MMLLIWNGMVVVVIVVRSRQPQETFGGKNHQIELADFSPISHVWEMGEKEESGMNTNLVHTLRLRVTNKKKRFWKWEVMRALLGILRLKSP